MAECRQVLSEAFLNLRLNPVRMLQCAPEEIAQDTESLLKAAASAGSLEKVGLCCINMDYGTPDENIFGNYSPSCHFDEERGEIFVESINTRRFLGKKRLEMT